MKNFRTLLVSIWAASEVRGYPIIGLWMWMLKYNRVQNAKKMGT